MHASAISIPDPSGVEALLGRGDLDLGVLGCGALELVEQSVAKALEERRAARQHDVRVECLP